MTTRRPESNLKESFYLLHKGLDTFAVPTRISSHLDAVTQPVSQLHHMLLKASTSNYDIAQSL